MLSILINKLEELYAKHGNVDVGYEDDCRGVTISDVTYNETWEEIEIK
jgi:hypothetical protein